MNEKISVIVPVYNTHKYLKRCVESICIQSYKNLEIILVDDGSTDGSSDLCDSLAKKDNRIKVIHKKNSGLSDTRNVGIKNSSGSILSFIDSDDYIENNMYKHMLEKMTSNECEIAICGWYVVKNGNRVKSNFKSEPKILTREEGIDKLLCNNSFDNFMCNKIFSKELFNDIAFPVGKKMEDLATLYKLINKSNKIYLDGIPYYNYFIREDSITNNLVHQIDTESFKFYIDRKDNLLKKYPSLKNRILSNYFTACRHNLFIAYESPNRNYSFESERERDLKKYKKYIWKDNSLSLRNKLSFYLSALNPKLFYKIRFRK